MYPQISEYLIKVLDKNSKINPIYIRNFSELLRLIPFVGPFVEANTVGAIKDYVLEKRLKNLENFCGEALTTEDANLLISKITYINSILFTIIAQYQEDIFKDNQKIKKLIKSYLTIPKDSVKEFVPNPMFYLIILSGASATGKDTLLDLLHNSYYPNHSRCELLRKFTTRKKRPTDSRYYKFLTSKQFKSFLEQDRIIFPYYKRQHRYGFDKIHLFDAATSDYLLFCVFTEFNILPKAKQFLKEQGIKVVSILPEAPEEHLINRSWTRALPENDVKARINSIKNDLAYIKSHRKDMKKMFDHIVYNGDDRAKLDTFEELRSILSKY